MYEWFKSLTGEWGPVLLNFYLSNSAWINSIIACYGVLLVFAWRTYDKVEQRMINDLVIHAKGKKVPSDLTLSWEEALEGIKYPWIATRGHLILRRLTPQNAELIINPQALQIRALTLLERIHR